VEEGEIIFSVAGEGLSVRQEDAGLTYRFSSTSGPFTGGPGGDFEAQAKAVTVESSVTGAEVEVDGAQLRIPFKISPEEPATAQLLWSCWHGEPVLEVGGAPAPFKYRQFFQSVDKLRTWASKQRENIEQRCDFLDGLFQDWSLGQTTSNLSALGLHSFLACSWWVRQKDGPDWFSVWEGSCYFHSTVDVEYNDALLYFALWPELLEMLLREWVQFEVDAADSYGPQAKGASYLCHDMGAMHVTGRQAYDHQMEVEENANYLLLLAAWTLYTGNREKARRKLPLCRRLAEFIVRSDTTGNGFPDQGTANTIDDASPAIQFGKEQVYLAVKAQAALWALAGIEDLLCEQGESKSERWKAFASKGVKTLSEKAWMGDHFVVTLTRSTEGLKNPWTGEALPDGELEGWDDYSIYAPNGLLYLFLANIKMPRWNLSRFARDVETAERATRTAYGSTHTASGDQTIWFSQNLWRDYVAAYLGLDLLAGAERYWDYQLLTGDNLDSSLYYDTTPHNNLNFYPRGATVFGAALSAAGLRLNRVEGELHLSPVRSSLRVPLLPLADWKGMRCPWLTVRSRDGVTTAEISERDLTGKLVVHITGAEEEQA
jgi:hypothetical protein